MAFGAAGSKIEVLLTAKDDASKKMAGVANSAEAMASKLKRTGAAMMAMGTVGILAIGKIVKDATIYALTIDKLSKVTGIGVERIQQLRYAAIQEHASMEVLEKGLMNLAIRIGYAGDGLETYLRSFRNLGIEIHKTDGMLKDSLDVMMELADSFATGEITTEKLYNSLMLLGVKGGKALIPLFKLGREGIKALMEEAKKYGIMTQAQVTAFKKYADSIDALKQGFLGIKVSIGNALIPTVKKLVDIITGLTEKFQKLPESIKKIVPMIALFGSVALVAGGAGLVLKGMLMGLSMFKFAAIAAGFHTIAISLHAVATPIQMLNAALISLIALWSVASSVTGIISFIKMGKEAKNLSKEVDKISVAYDKGDISKETAMKRMLVLQEKQGKLVERVSKEGPSWSPVETAKKMVKALTEGTKVAYAAVKEIKPPDIKLPGVDDIKDTVDKIKNLTKETFGISDFMPAMMGVSAPGGLTGIIKPGTKVINIQIVADDRRVGDAVQNELNKIL